MVEIDVFKKLRIFNAAPAGALEHLARNAEEKSYMKGDVICREADKGEGFYLIISGSVTVEKKLLQDDQSSKVIARLGPEQFFGEMAFLQNQPYSATVVAQEATHVITLSRTALDDMANKNAKAALDQLLTMMTGLSDRLRFTTRELVTIFEIARWVGSGLTITELAKKVLEQLSIALPGQSLAFYQWNEFNEEYNLLQSVGPNKSQFLDNLSGSEKVSTTNQTDLFVPIERENKKEGMLLLQSDSGAQPTSSEKQMLESVAAVLAPALATARFHEEELSRKRLARSKQQGQYS